MEPQPCDGERGTDPGNKILPTEEAGSAQKPDNYSSTTTSIQELRFVGPELGVHPAATFVPAAGCYAYQVDTRRSSYLIVFEARYR